MSLTVIILNRIVFCIWDMSRKLHLICISMHLSGRIYFHLQHTASCLFILNMQCALTTSQGCHGKKKQPLDMQKHRNAYFSTTWFKKWKWRACSHGWTDLPWKAWGEKHKVTQKRKTDKNDSRWLQVLIFWTTTYLENYPHSNRLEWVQLHRNRSIAVLVIFTGHLNSLMGLSSCLNK